VRQRGSGNYLKEVILKYLLTLASALVLMTSNAIACPHADKARQAKAEEAQASPLLSEAEETTDPNLLLLLKEKEAQVSYN